jgi:endoglucanase
MPRPTERPRTAPTTTRRRPALLTGVALAATACAASAIPASAAAPVRAGAPGASSLTSARLANPGNPLAGRRWGVYKGRADQAWEPYARSTGAQRRLLGKIALRPRATWFGAWTSNADIARKVNKYIASMSGGNRNVLVQMAVFRMKPWEHKACRRLPTAAEQSSYKQWIARYARAVGSQHAAVILQPDGPFALCAPHGSKLPSHLIRYAARRFAALPHTAVYIDAGASDWPSRNPRRAADILMPAGIRSVRGFALNSTHYTSTGANIAFGTQVLAALARRGVHGKHFVVNTAQNGRAFTWGQKRGNNFDNSPVCANRRQTRCVTLGIPPTTHVASVRWHLSRTNRARAAAHVDGYLWFGRPWLYMQADPFVKSRALQLARTTRY